MYTCNKCKFTAEYTVMSVKRSKQTPLSLYVLRLETVLRQCLYVQGTN